MEQEHKDRLLTQLQETGTITLWGDTRLADLLEILDTLGVNLEIPKLRSNCGVKVRI